MDPEDRCGECECDCEELCLRGSWDVDDDFDADELGLDPEDDYDA